MVSAAGAMIRTNVGSANPTTASRTEPMMTEATGSPEDEDCAQNANRYSSVATGLNSNAPNVKAIIDL